jgi:hypothetical protein
LVFDMELSSSLLMVMVSACEAAATARWFAIHSGASLVHRPSGGEATVVAARQADGLGEPRIRECVSRSIA